MAFQLVTLSSGYLAPYPTSLALSKNKLTVRKRQFKFTLHIMRKEDLENIPLTGYAQGKRSGVGGEATSKLFNV